MGDIVTVVSAALSVLGAIVAGVMTTWSARRNAMFEHRLAAERHEASKAEQAQEVISRYREPLLLAAFNLQSRLHNAVGGVYLPEYLNHEDEDERRYARDYTVYVLADYFCWVEIIRRDLRFLDLGDEGSNRTFNRHLTLVGSAFASLKLPGTHFRLFKGQQRAIGELMIVTANGRADSLTYPAFCSQLDNNDEFRRWFRRLVDDVAEVVVHDWAGNERLVRAQHALIDLIDFLDPSRTRLPDDRAKLIEPRPSAEPAAGAQAAPVVF
ncbi:hypothetical protein [Catellatospora sichuanensis]|uniref:hypothetical protein n=1 Tax=Catellatospora sichuanensis TaxID=1969805 RepID=UPI001182339E|nr:hypothetical protein [Catellatospora sichuanensis]